MSSVIFGPALASVVGPYAVIVIASTVGAAWALGRRASDAKLGAVLYFLRLNATAMLVTVSIASAAARWLGIVDRQWMLAPVALTVGCIGDDWPTVGRWIARRAGQLLERKTGGGAGQ